MAAMQPFRPDRQCRREPSDSVAGCLASARPSWPRRRRGEMERECECGRRCALPTEACVASSVIQQRTLVGRITAHDQADEDRVIAAGHGELFFALDMRDHTVEYSDPMLVLAIAHAAKSIGFRGRE